jgi:hypothetical protein
MSEPNDDPFIADLLAAERRRRDVPPATADALFQSILAASAHAAVAKAPSPEAPPPPPEAPVPAKSASIVRSLLASRPLIAIASLAVGIGIGASARPLFDPSPQSPRPVVDVPPRVVTRTPEVASPPFASVPLPLEQPAAPATRPDDLPPAPPVRLPAPPSARSVAPGASSAPATSLPREREEESGLGAERVLIETARSALARGDAPSALASLEAHEKRHPKGQLGEERDALLVQTLALAGRKRDAVERAARFRLAYPSSVFLPSVDAAVR